MTVKNWQVKKLSGSIGAELTGNNLKEATATDVEFIRQQLLENLVVFFPGQHLDIDEHVKFGGYFGELEGHPNLKNPFTKHPQVFELAASEGGVADEWHTDITFQEEPALMSILNMLKCPAAGGDTMWSSLYAAFEELSPPMQNLCEGLTALHDALPHNRPEKMAVHPVVRVHPETGRKVRYVNEHFTRRIVEMNATESENLLSYLTRWVANPRFTVRYSWSEGTIAIWDNRCTQHFVLNDFSGERIIQRVTIMGDKPVGCENPRWQPWGQAGRRTAMSRHDRQLFNFLKSREN